MSERNIKNGRNEQLMLWIEKADHDLGTAIITYRYIPKYKDTIAFHCQQAVEKYLKAYIFYLELTIKRTHDLVYLLEQIGNVEESEYHWFEKALELQDYAIEVRYPDHKIDLTDTNVESAIQIAREFRDWILERLNIQIDFDDIK